MGNKKGGEEWSYEDEAGSNGLAIFACIIGGFCTIFGACLDGYRVSGLDEAICTIWTIHGYHHLGQQTGSQEDEGGG